MDPRTTRNSCLITDLSLFVGWEWEFQFATPGYVLKIKSSRLAVANKVILFVFEFDEI